MLIARDFTKIFSKIPTKADLKGDVIIRNPSNLYEAFESDLEFVYMLWLAYFFDVKETKNLLRSNCISISLLVQIFSRTKDIYVDLRH